MEIDLVAIIITFVETLIAGKIIKGAHPVIVSLISVALTLVISLIGEKVSGDFSSGVIIGVPSVIGFIINCFWRKKIKEG